MTKGFKGGLRLAALALVAAAASPASAAGPDVLGVWLDHTGRGAVEISRCGDKDDLCGKLVWLKDTKHKEGCGLQIFGDVKPVAERIWDNGWIIDPEKDLTMKYSVELTLVSETSLKVVGYLGTKLLSETMMWKRAPTDIKRCVENEQASPPPPKKKKKAS